MGDHRCVANSIRDTADTFLSVTPLALFPPKRQVNPVLIDAGFDDIDRHFVLKAALSASLPTVELPARIASYKVSWLRGSATSVISG
jgi:hypothetical protein